MGRLGGRGARDSGMEGLRGIVGWTPSVDHRFKDCGGWQDQGTIMLGNPPVMTLEDILSFGSVDISQSGRHPLQ